MVVILMLLVVVGGGVLILTTGGDDEGGGGNRGGSDGGNGGEIAASPDTPVGAAEAFFAAVAAGDCSTLGALVVQNADSDEMLQNCQSSPEDFSGGVELLGATEGEQLGEGAVQVDVTIRYQVVSGGAPMGEEPTTSIEGTETTTVPVTMVLEGDTWKLDVSTLLSS